MPEGEWIVRIISNWKKRKRALHIHASLRKIECLKCGFSRTFRALHVFGKFAIGLEENVAGRLCCSVELAMQGEPLCFDVSGCLHADAKTS